ncbi:MAG: adenylosuccinate lyase [Patescibacteria group bacterium]|nr:adenylosuccinate lyase [Patescibacteria group bacterium]
MNLNSLTAISPIDGRYRHELIGLSEYFSEWALIKYRIKVEVLYLIALSSTGVIRKLTAHQKKLLLDLVENFDVEDAKRVKQIEQKTNHDVKSVEYWIKEKLTKTPLVDLKEFVHFGLTSEDINNLAYDLMIVQALDREYLPELNQLLSVLGQMAKKYRSLPMMARTHGQPASPTTMGKELAVFYDRLKTQLELMPTLTGKLNGAVGNYNAHQLAFPKVNWLKFSQDFVGSLGLKPNLVTTQIEPHDVLAELFQVMTRINTILIGLDRDVWGYISLGYFKQSQKVGEVGSSTMPHKVNPINFESSEGNLGLANAILDHMANKLPISRFQRDLSDSTVLRNIGVAVGHSMLAYKSTRRGLGKLEINQSVMARDLDSHPELLAEAIQVVLRREGVNMPYETLKDLTRGKEISLADLHSFIDRFNISAKVKLELQQLTPAKYVGLASKIVSLVV